MLRSALGIPVRGHLLAGPRLSWPILPRMAHQCASGIVNAFDLSPEEGEIVSVIGSVLSRQDEEQVVVRIVGGWVRDKVLRVRQEDADLDLMVEGISAEKFAELMKEFAGSRCSSIGIIREDNQKGKNLDTVTFQFDKKKWIEVSGIRNFGRGGQLLEEIDRNLPMAVQDAKWRDLTINSLFFNLNSNSLEDFTGKGLDDIRNRTIRTPLDPEKTFLDDPLRILRCVRFALQLGFSIDEQIFIAARSVDVQNALRLVSRERFGKELSKILEGQSAARSFELICRLGIFPILFEIPSALISNPVDSVNSDEFQRSCWIKPQIISQLCENIPVDCAENPIEIRRNWLLASFLLPFAEIRYRERPSGRELPLTFYIVRNSLKMRNKDANLVHFFHEGALKMRHHLEQSNAGDTDFDSKRLQIGLDLHYCGIYWTVLLRMASMTLENVDVDKNMHGIHLLESWINSSGLVGCWNWTPIFSGKQLLEEPFLFRGKRVGEALQRQIELRILNPEMSDSDCAAEIIHYFSDS